MAMVRLPRQGIEVYTRSKEVRLVAASVTLVNLTARQELTPEVMVVFTLEWESPASNEMFHAWQEKLSPAPTHVH